MRIAGLIEQSLSDREVKSFWVRVVDGITRPVHYNPGDVAMIRQGARALFGFRHAGRRFPAWACTDLRVGEREDFGITKEADVLWTVLDRLWVDRVVSGFLADDLSKGSHDLDSLWEKGYLPIGQLSVDAIQEAMHMRRSYIQPARELGLIAAEGSAITIAAVDLEDGIYSPVTLPTK
ncbi:MAG TPA: hypothetical protein VJ836_06040 [Candidatus Saccharimonadales bacterium]|nr:hypothetical protein [Candidatus Saccharimonadales bacterium]